MPVRGLVVGMALAKSNELCNFIGCREINETDVGSWIMRNDVNKKNDTESFVNCMPYCILCLLYFDVLTSY